MAASIFNERVLNTESHMGSILSKTSQQMFKNEPRPLIKSNSALGLKTGQYQAAAVADNSRRVHRDMLHALGRDYSYGDLPALEP